VKSSRGFSLIEIVVALGVFSIIVFATMQVFFVSQGSVQLNEQKIKAGLLLNEFLEGVKNIQRNNWNDLQNGRFIISDDGNGSLVLTVSDGETIAGFTRFLDIQDAFRDETGQLATSGTLDSSTKKVTATVTWQTKQISQTVYLTRYFENLAWTQTTVADWQAGERNLVKVVDPILDNGEIKLVGGCQSGSPESLIYDDALRNGWRANCDGLPFWQRLWCLLNIIFGNSTIQSQSAEQTHNSSAYAIKITLVAPSSGSRWSWVRIFNYDEVCTVGFRNLHFFVFNPTGSPVNVNVTAVYGQWDRRTITLAPGVWTEISLDYESLEGSYENNLESIYFSRSLSAGDPSLTFFVDDMDLTGGIGGFFTEGTLTSSILDTDKSSAFNRVSFSADLPANTAVGTQTAVANDLAGPWVFTGPGGTGLSNDLYTAPEGEGIRLGGNLGRYFRYKAYLKSTDGVSTPILRDVTVNYSP